MFDEAFFNSVLKCCRWRKFSASASAKGATTIATDVFAACGNDGVVGIFDERAGRSTQHFTASHSAVNTVEWHPAKEELLLTDGFDSLKLWDVRKTKSALFQLSAHNQRAKRSLLRPIFARGGRYIATPGEGSQNLTYYRVDNGAVACTKFVGYTPTSLYEHGPSGHVFGPSTSQLWMMPKSVLHF